LPGALLVTLARRVFRQRAGFIAGLFESDEGALKIAIFYLGGQIQDLAHISRGVIRTTEAGEENDFEGWILVEVRRVSGRC
jgi:hypothetical protein